MRLLLLNRGADTGGGSIKIKRAFAKHAPDWEVRCARGADNYLAFPSDFTFDSRDGASVEQLRALFVWADVVHLVNDEKIGRLLPDYAAKPKVVHMRGRGFWTQPGDPTIASLRERGIPVLVSTPNLLQYDPWPEWMPNTCDLEAMARVRRQARRTPKRRPLAVHAPTMRGTKGTDAWLAGIAPLRDRLDLDLIEGVPWLQCLARKARGDLLLDQLDLAYVSNAIEAWGMGIPGACGIAGDFMAAWYASVPGYVPFAPLLTHFWHLLFPKKYETWLAHDAAWIRVCDAILRIPGKSGGADRETALAEQIGIPTFHSIEALTDHFHQIVSKPY